MKTLKTITIAIILTFATLTTAQTKKPVAKTATKPSTQTNYPSVQIAGQEWMSKNLNVSTFRNGDPIPRAQTNQEWTKANNERKPAWCYYHIGYSEIKKYGDPESGKYGKLYNYYAVYDPRGLAPKGWHIGTPDEWHNLISLFTYKDNAEHNFTDIPRPLRSTTGWSGSEGDIYKASNGTNSTGFNVLPAGCRDPYGNYQDSLGDEAYFWFQTNDANGVGTTYSEAYYLKITNGFTSGYFKNNYNEGWTDKTENPRYGFSVRCVKDIVVTPVVQEKKGPTAQNYYDNGNIKFNSKDYKGAIEDYSNAINLSPECSFCYQLRGFSKGELSDYNGSISDYKKAIELSDGNLDFISPCQLNIGITYNMIGEKEEGCNFLKDSQNNGNKEAQKYIDQFCGESEPKKQLEPGIEKVHLSCGQINEDAKVLSKPDPNSIETDFIGLPLSFFANSKITNDKGIFYSGQLVNSNGKVLEGIYYILASEWKCQ